MGGKMVRNSGSMESSDLSPTRRIRLRSPRSPSPDMPRLTGGARLRWKTVKVLHPSGVIRVTRLTPSHAIRDFEAFVARVTPELNSVLLAEVARGPVKAKITLSVILSRGNGGETKPFASGKMTDANTLLPITRASEVAPQVAAMLAVARQRFAGSSGNGSILSHFRFAPCARRLTPSLSQFSA